MKRNRARREPRLVTRPEQRAVLEELMSREPIFHRPELLTSQAALESMTVADFWEVGASGRRYSRDYVLETVAERLTDAGFEDRWQSEDFHCRELCADVYLLTYTLKQRGRVTRRATIWQRHGRGWQAVFHQGTLVREEEGSDA
jgi:hypothetical protein